MSETNRLGPESATALEAVFTRLLDAPRELVFRLWTDPAHLVRWWGPKDFTLPSCELDLRPGGAYRFCMRSPAGSDHWVWGVYREIVVPERLVFTWEREDEPGLRFQSRQMLVTVTLAEVSGKTLLSLRHTGFQTVADRIDHQGGWTQCLDRLVATAAAVGHGANQPAAENSSSKSS